MAESGPGPTDDGGPSPRKGVTFCKRHTSAAGTCLFCAKWQTLGQVSWNGYGMATEGRVSFVRGEAAEVAGARKAPAPEAPKRSQHELPATSANTGNPSAAPPLRLLR